MNNILIRQIIALFLSLFALTIFTFGLTLFFPFEATTSMGLAPEQSNNLAHQYYLYLSNILTGQWGISQVQGSQVFQDFFVHFPATAELAIIALFFAMAVGIPLGITAAQNKNKWQDKVIVSTTLVGYSMPIFWWGMLLILLFSVYLGITPVASRLGFEYDILPISGFMLIDTLKSQQPYAVEAFFDALSHLLLPAIVLGTIPLAIFTRVTRSAMIEVLSSDYIRTAKAKGLSNSRIIWLHALRNAMIPIVTVTGLQVSVLITGALITETIFSWPGVGKWLLEAVYRRDYATIHGGILAMATFVIFINILVEICLHFIDPKLRVQK